MKFQSQKNINLHQQLAQQMMTLSLTSGLTDFPEIKDRPHTISCVRTSFASGIRDKPLVRIRGDYGNGGPVSQRVCSTSSIQVEVQH